MGLSGITPAEAGVDQTSEAAAQSAAGGGVELIIRGPKGETLPVGAIGEIVTRSSFNMLG